MKNDYYYCIVLSNEQLRFFAESKYHIDRMKILKLLIDNAVTKETTYKITGFTTTLHVGQVAISAVELGNQLVYDKKTVTKLLDCMVQLGIITSEKNNRTSIHTLHCVSAWYVNNQQILNPHYIHIKDRQQKSTNADESTTKLVASTDNLSAGESTPASEPSGQSNFHSYEAESSMNIKNQSIESIASSIPNVHSHERANDDVVTTTKKSAMNTDKSTSLSQLSIVQSTNDDYNMRISSSADDDLYTPSQDNGNAHIAEHNNSLSAMTTAEDDETHDNQYTDTQPPHAEEV
ncbi:MAG: hypothetical protein EOM41_06310 [Bacilli bacterium]|jgi:hypothetical protein|nr:hypothetical protein [Bacilli bacterium]